MPIQGEIKTLYKNKNNTSPIFPTTKIKAVSDENGIGLDALLRDNYATKTYVTSEIAKAQVGGDDSEIDLSGFATKDDVANIKHPISSVNNKTGEVVLTAEDIGARPDNWMPTAEQVGARPDTWMPTAGQIGASPDNTRLTSILLASQPCFNFTICGDATIGATSSASREVAEIIVTDQGGGLSHLFLPFNANDGSPKNSLYEAINRDAYLISAKYQTIGNETHYSIYYYAQKLYSYAQVIIPRLANLSVTQHEEVTEGNPVYIRSVMTEHQPYNAGCFFRRFDTEAEWQWWNPPMKLGHEYRTTERWDGKVVYTRLIDCGTMPSAGAIVWKAFGANTGITNIIRVLGVASNTYTVPYNGEAGEVSIGGLANTDNAWIFMKGISGDFTAHTCIAQVWYVR